MKRDSQRGKLYKAEEVIWNCKRLETVSELQEYADKVMNSPWTKKHWPRCRKAIIKDGRRHRRAVCYGNTIAMPRWSRSEAVLLHELAHVLCGANVGHGWEFAQTFLRLVQHWMGAEAADRLKA